MQKSLKFCFLMFSNVPFTNSLFSTWDTSNPSLIICCIIVHLFQCLVHWNPLPRRFVCLTTKPPFANDLYMAGNVSGKARQSSKYIGSYLSKFTWSNAKQGGVALWMADKWRSQSLLRNDLIRSLRTGATSLINVFQYRTVELFSQPCCLNWSNFIFRWVISVSHFSHVYCEISWSEPSACFKHWLRFSNGIK